MNSFLENCTDAEFDQYSQGLQEQQYSYKIINQKIHFYIFLNQVFF